MNGVSEAYLLIPDLAIALGADPISKHVGCWEYKLGGRWLLAVNGHRTPTQTSTGHDVPPWHAYVERDGWSGGLLSPSGGTTIDAEAEDDLIAELKLAIHGPEDAR